MTLIRSTTLAALMTVMLPAFAQNPTGPGGSGHAAPHGPGAGAKAAAPADRMAMMDQHMARMHEMHEKMSRAASPQERQALMADHMKLMQQGMAMMGGMGHGGMGTRPMGPGGAASAPMDMATRQQMMEKRMEMMQSMMQMMMDRMGPPAVKP